MGPPAMKSRAQDTAFWMRAPLAGAAMGGLVGAMEVAHLAMRGILLDPMPAAPVSVQRMAMAGLCFGLLLTLGGALALAFGVRARRHLALLPLAATVGTAAYLVSQKWLKADAPLVAQVLWLFLGGVGMVTACAWVRLHRWRAGALWAMLLIAAAAALVFLDPEGLRGTYPALGLGMLGMALGAATLSALIMMSRRMSATGMCLVLAAIWGLSVLLPSQPASILAASNRIRILDRAWQQVQGQHSDQSDDFGTINVDELLRPPDPELRQQARKKWAQQTQDRKPKNLLWVTMDAVRADCTGALGGKLTPNLDALAEEGHAFTNAFSQAPGTAFSVESFTTSRHPSYSALALAWQAGGEERIKFPPIAQWLTDQGLKTGFITGLTDSQLNHRTFERLNRGFAEVHTSPGDADAARTVKAAQEWLRRYKDQPFFAWVHFFDPHHPYVPRLGTSPNASARERYESEVRYADQALGQLVDALKEVGKYDDTVIVVHADHAEAFGEHGRYYHSTSYYDTQLHVPLVLRVPGLKPGVIKKPVGCVDIIPSVCDALLLPSPPHAQGFSLLPTLMNPDVPWPPAAFAESLIIEDDGRWTDERIRMVTDGRWKLLDWRSSRMHLLFDRQADPEEQKDIAAENPEQVQRMLAYLEALDRELRRNETDREKLKAITWEQVRGALATGDLPTRRAIMERLWAGQRRDLIQPLTEEFHGLREGVAHQTLVMLDDILVADSQGSPAQPPLPDRAGAYRLRLLERFGSWPNCWDTKLPELPAELSAPERQAVLMAQAARGDGEAQDALLSNPPTNTTDWFRFALPLIAGGTKELTPFLANTLKRSARDRPFIRAFRAALRGDPGSAADLLVQIWPSPVRRLEPSSHARLVELALPLGLEHPEALLALHSAASPREADIIERTLHDHHAWSTQAIQEASRAWAEARRSEVAQGQQPDLKTVLSALGTTVPLPCLRAEHESWTHKGDFEIGDFQIRWHRTSRTEPLLMPIRCTLLARSAQPLGPAGLNGIDFYWVRTDGAERTGTTLNLPRELLQPDDPKSLSVVLGIPVDSGEWSLKARRGGTDAQLEVIGMPPWTRVTDQNSFRERALLTRLSAWPIPLRSTAMGAYQELFEDSHGGFITPSLKITSKKARVTITGTAWFPKDADFRPSIRWRVPGAESVTMEPWEHDVAEEHTLVVPPPPAETAVLEVRWPLCAALVELTEVAVEFGQ